MRPQTWIQRYRRVLTYEFSGGYSYEACDINQRERIDRLVSKLGKILEATAQEGINKAGRLFG